MALPTWLGGSQPPQKKLLFLYHEPFVIEDTLVHRSDLLWDYLGDKERADLEAIYGTFLRFAAQENLIDVADANYTQSKETNTGSWIWAVNWSSFRSLVNLTDYSNLVNSLQVRDNYPLAQIIELHAKLGMLYDGRLLNTLVNRVLSAIQLIPYPVDDNAESITWQQIHRETPFIWIVILLQNIIRSTVRKF